MIAPLAIALTAAALASTSSQAYQLPLRLTPSSWQAATSTNAAASTGNYTSHALLRLTPPSSTVSSLKHAAQELGLDVWRASAASCSRSNNTVGQGCLELRFPPLLASLRQDACSALRSIMPEAENCQVLLPDVGAVIEQQRAEGEAKALLRRKRRSEAEEEEPDEFFDDYRPIEEIEAYMRHLVATYPSLARLQVLGTTHEGRPIMGLTIGTQKEESASGSWADVRRWKLPVGKLRRFGGAARATAEPGEKVGFVIAAEMHAREFISTTVSLYFATRLLSSASTASRSRKADLLSTFDITIIPLSNPDGYAYAWEHERLWRKNRQPGTLGCHGVDPAAGFPFHFRAGYNPCSEAYPGRSALQAEETRALANFVADVDNRVVGFVDLHSYGQQLTYPFSFSCDEPVPDEEDLAELSIGAARALHDAHRTTFATGRTCETLFTSSGTSIDYAYTSGIKWSYSMELRDEGAYGFLLPASHIRPSGEETSDALTYMLQFVKLRRNGKRLTAK